MGFPRESGLILHPTSLPGPYGIGEIGPEAYKFIDALVDMGQHLWQVLPLGPTSYGDSPYQSPSTFAGNPLLISLEKLCDDDLLSCERLKKLPEFPDGSVNYGWIIPERFAVLRAACRAFSRQPEARKRDFKDFCEREAYWLDDYALFMAIKDDHSGVAWPFWPAALVRRDPQALAEARRKYRLQARNYRILQYLFHDQWEQVRSYAHQKGIKIIGDLPIFVAHDSADVWAHPELFYLDGHGHLTAQAGVPPDYFSKTGQLWGNPLYRWDVHQKGNFSWWISRIRKALEMFDVLRIDHFRGFDAYWEVPAKDKTAIHGRWVKAPGMAFFKTVMKELNNPPILAEDLGNITKEVIALRDHFKFPSMRILQFAFGTDPAAKTFLPENYSENIVAFTGTHDNDTAVGWFNTVAGVGNTVSPEEVAAERKRALAYLKSDGREINWDLMKVVLNSKANIALFPLQDVLGLGSEARMNLPGRPDGNWAWRFQWDTLTTKIKQRMSELTKLAHRTH